jgi:hypothetical protein
VELLKEGRGRRVARLATAVERLTPEERSVLETAATLLERMIGAPEG